MTDPREATRATYARWLRVRANVRALSHSLAATEYRLQRDLRQCATEPDVVTLLAQLRIERSQIDVLAKELDARIAAVKRECAAIEASYVAQLRARLPVRMKKAKL